MHVETGLATVSSPEVHPLQECQHGFLTRPSRPLEGCFAATLPLQIAHGFCRGRSMTRLARRGDVHAAVTHLVIKGGTTCCPHETDLETFLFGDRGKAGATLHRDVNSGTPHELL